MRLSHQNRDCLDEVEHRKCRIGRDTDDHIAAIEVVSGQTAGFVAENEGSLLRASLEQKGDGLGGGKHRKVFAPSSRCRCRQSAVRSAGLGKARPSSALQLILGAAGPAEDLRIVGGNRRAHQLESRNSEVGRNPHGGPKVTGQTGFDQNQGSY